MANKQIPVDKLQFGMYVAELDRPWTETPFSFQGFILRSERQLELLRQHCNTVFIDPEKSERRLFEGAAGEKDYPERTTVENELAAARRAYDDCEQVLQENLAALKAGGEIDARQLKAAVTAVSNSVVRNADAMLLLTRLREKGGYELRHALESSVLMITFGRFLQLDRERLDVLGLVGLLQDVGKMRVPDSILHKTMPLTSDELQEARLHVEHAAEILQAGTGALAPEVVQTVLLHHERNDGSGYPRGVQGPAITMQGTMAGIVDSFSALTALRPYAAQMSPSNALGLLYKERSRLFNEALVEQFIQCIGIYPVGSVVELNTAEVAIVIAQNRVRRLQPRVMVVLDRGGNPLRPQKMLDLLKEPKASADEPYRIRRTLEAAKLPLDPRDFFL